jgi:hypothetical protein
MQCRQDGMAYVQKPIDLPYSIRVGGDRTRLLLRLYEPKHTSSIVGGVILVGVTVMPVAIIMPIFDSDRWHYYAAFFGSILAILLTMLLFDYLGRGDRLVRTDCILDKEGISIWKASRSKKWLEDKFGWKGIKYIDPYSKVYAAPRTNESPNSPFAKFGIKVILKNRIDYSLLENIEAAEQALFLAYHMQKRHQLWQEDRELPEQDKPDPPVAAVLQSTLIDEPAPFKGSSEVARELACNRCGAPTGISEVSTRFKIAFCGYCNSILDVTDRSKAIDGMKNLMFGPPYSYRRTSKGLSITTDMKFPAKASPAQPKKRPITFVQIALCVGILLFFSLAVFANSYLLAIPAGLLFAVVSWIHVNREMDFEMQKERAKRGYFVKGSARFVIKPKSVTQREKRTVWKTTGKVESGLIRDVYAMIDVDDETSSRIVFDLKDGHSFATFELPSPWHANELGKEIRKILGKN